MKFKIIRFSLFGIFCLILTQLSAQTNYLAEIGVNAGGSYVLGDINSIPFKHQQLDFGLIYRQNFNERISAHAEWNISGLYHKDLINNVFDTVMVNMVDLCGEFNFFDLIKKEYKPMSKSFSPYIFTGIGMAYTTQSGVIFNIPFGIGFKYKLGNRINLNAKWAHRLMFNDKIDGVVGPLNGSNFLNNDLVSTYTIGVSYDFWEKPCNCNKSHEISF